MGAPKRMQDGHTLGVGNKMSVSEDGGGGRRGARSCSITVEQTERGRYELLWPPVGKGEGDEGEGDTEEKREVEEVESVTGGELDNDQGTRGQPGGQEEERVWQDV